MFRTEAMQKVRIIGLLREKPKIVRQLHRMGVIEIRKSKLEIQDDAPETILPRLSELVVRYTTALAVLSEQRKKAKIADDSMRHPKQLQPKLSILLEMAKKLDAMNDTLLLEEKRVEVEKEIARVSAEIGAASLFLGSGIDFSRLSSDTLAFNAYALSKKARKEAAGSIRELRRKYEVIENETDLGLALLVAYDRGDPKAVEALESIGGVKKVELHLPDFDSTAEKTVEKLRRIRSGLEREKLEILTKLEKHARDDYWRIESFLEMLSIEAERASASINFKKTDSTFVVEGWVQKMKIGEIERKLEEITHGAFSFEEIESDELAPTLLSRPRFFRPFDNLMEFFSLPRSDELDPTWIFIVSFPLFYGLMVSDVGYGIASFIFAWLIAKRTEAEGLVNSVARVWQISSLAVIAFGFLSNQYFGFGLNQYLISGFSGFDWLRDTPVILAATVIFGIAQVSIGLLLGFINSRARGHNRLALAKLTSIAAITAGAVAVGGALFGMFSGTATEIAAGVGVLSLIATVALSGTEAAEVVSLISHPLSYARIMGFGLASVILALLIDKAFTPSLSAGVLSFLLASVIFILLHFVNMTLGIFEGMVQGARLNFVEFFSKFYTGGGIKFRPFFYRRRYTKEAQSWR